MTRSARSGSPAAPAGSRTIPEAGVPEFLDLHSKTAKALRAVADAAMRRHGLRLGQDHLLAVL
jgi:hypothetical protein